MEMFVFLELGTHCLSYTGTFMSLQLCGPSAGGMSTRGPPPHCSPQPPPTSFLGHAAPTPHAAMPRPGPQHMTCICEGRTAAVELGALSSK